MMNSCPSEFLEVELESASELEAYLTMSDTDSAVSYPPSNYSPPRTRGSTSMGRGELEQLRTELSHANDMIRDQAKQLEKCQKRIEELEGTVAVQREALRKYEVLKVVLAEEKKHRLATEQKLNEILQATNPPLVEEQVDPLEDPLLRRPRSIQESEDEDVMVIKIVEKTRENYPRRPLRLHEIGPIKRTLGIPQDKKFTCKICGFSFNQRWHLISHMKSFHHGQFVQGSVMQRSPVPLPGQRSLARNPLEKSSTAQAEDSTKMVGKFSCDICMKKFPILSILKRHKLQDHGIDEKEFLIGCTDCGQVFPNRKLHATHRKQAHGRKRQPLRLQTPQPLAGSTLHTKHGVALKLGPGHFCLCGLCFQSNDHLKKHLELAPKPSLHQANLHLTASGDRRISTPPTPTNQPVPIRHGLIGPEPVGNIARFVCTCGKVVLTRSAFNAHIRVLKDKEQITFKCSECPEKFADYNTLREHFMCVHST